jgi:hypothetical protein
MIQMALNKSSQHSEDNELIFQLLTVRYLHLVMTDTNLTNAPKVTPPLRCHIDEYHDYECKLMFSFRSKSCLHRLKTALKFPESVTFSNRSRMSGEECFLRGLYEIVSGDNQEKICINVFGRECTTQSRAFSYFIHHIYDNFIHLLTNNLDWFYKNGFFAESAAAIGNKMSLIDIMNLVFAFIDCNCLPSSVVGGGPCDMGANSARWHHLIQRAFYNGWKSIHGLKHQTVDIAHGLTIDICGPMSLRRNDLTLLRESNIVERIKQLQLTSENQYVIFGDSAYKKMSHLTSYFAADDIADSQIWNKKLKSVRIAIEWNYGYTAALYKYLGLESKLKLLQSSTVTKVYIVATLLRNCNVCLYGGQSSNYFNLVMRPDMLS